MFKHWIDRVKQITMYQQIVLSAPKLLTSVVIFNAQNVDAPSVFITSKDKTVASLKTKQGLIEVMKMSYELNKYH